MELTKCVLTFVCIFLVLFSGGEGQKRKSRRSKRNHRTCRGKSLVRYQMTVKTYWDKETFPKMYPTYRPPAHWSQVIGRSHGTKYRMWQEGTNASYAVQEFAEKENSQIFDLELSQGYNDVLDGFVAPDIRRGVGETSTMFFVDGGHSKVSFMVKIVPSPDWFIGIDSLDLCYRGRWKKALQLDLHPFDAGTDRGFTFTAPNWPTDPREPIMKITSSSPDHPAGSFFYPEYKNLPRLASVEFQMISEYRLKKVHKVVKPIPRNADDIIYPTRPSPQENVSSAEGKDNNLAYKSVISPLFDSGVSALQSGYANRIDCQVSKWSEWSSCSQTCGFGNKHRTRQVTVLPSNGGANCPLLKETSVCGSMRNCGWKHFSMMGSNAKKSPSPSVFRTTRRRRVRRRRKHLN